jgi:hypothetical protein
MTLRAEGQTKEVNMGNQDQSTCWACGRPTHTDCVRCGRHLCDTHAYEDPTPTTLWPMKRRAGKLCQPCYRHAEALATWSVRPLIG